MAEVIHKLYTNHDMVISLRDDSIGFGAYQYLKRVRVYDSTLHVVGSFLSEGATGGSGLRIRLPNNHLAIGWQKYAVPSEFNTFKHDQMDDDAPIRFAVEWGAYRQQVETGTMACFVNGIFNQMPTDIKEAKHSHMIIAHSLADRYQRLDKYRLLCEIFPDLQVGLIKGINHYYAGEPIPEPLGRAAVRILLNARPDMDPYVSWTMHKWNPCFREIVISGLGQVCLDEARTIFDLEAPLINVKLDSRGILVITKCKIKAMHIEMTELSQVFINGCDIASLTIKCKDVALLIIRDMKHPEGCSIDAIDDSTVVLPAALRPKLKELKRSDIATVISQ